MELYNEWKKNKQNSSVENLILSVGEILRYYQNGRINISPEYQRTYRWNNINKTKFIESLILGMPIPPIFAIKEETDEVLQFEIIDGLQRISTILEFTGVLEKEHRNTNEKLNTLEGADILLGLNGKTWEEISKTNMGFVFESSSLQFINLKTIDTKIKYETFKRLNTGGVILSSQEVRSNILAFKGQEKYNEFLKKYNRLTIEFLSKKDLKERRDMELFIEFSLIKEYKEFIKNYKRLGITELLDKYSEEVELEILENNLVEYEEFIKICNFSKFKRYNMKKDKFTGSFVSIYFEIAAFIFFKNKTILTKENIKKIFAQTYAEFCNIRNLQNPDAARRLKEAYIYVEENL